MVVSCASGNVATGSQRLSNTNPERDLKYLLKGQTNGKKMHRVTFPNVQFSVHMQFRDQKFDSVGCQ